MDWKEQGERLTCVDEDVLEREALDDGLPGTTAAIAACCCGRRCSAWEACWAVAVVVVVGFPVTRAGCDEIGPDVRGRAAGA
jgi:hypothetical protein